MAGLGDNVNTQFTIQSWMHGTAEFDSDTASVWFFDTELSGLGFMGDRFLPSAHFEPIEGELTQVHFWNWSPMAHTIHLHGMDVDQLNDGVPQTSFVIPAGGNYTYEFIAPHAGTYHYHCHVDTIMHYHRGMSGVVIVRPPDASINRAWDGGPTFDEEVAWQLQTYDITWDVQGESGPFTARHHPNYFLLNGKQTAQALKDPYTVVNLSVGQMAYLRVINMSYQWGRVALGGLPFEVVASDGRPMRKTALADVWEIAPGERYDLLLSADEPTEVDATVDYLDDYTGTVLGQAATRVTIS